jgi:hypothetical protein
MPQKPFNPLKAFFYPFNAFYNILRPSNDKREQLHALIMSPMHFDNYMGLSTI